MNIKLTALCLLFVCGSLVSRAQDVLVTKNGDALKVYGVELGSETVFYQEQQGTDAPTKRISKKDLLIIKYADGRVVNLADGSTADAAPQQSPATVTSSTVSAAATAENQKLINAYNSSPAQFIGERSGKKVKVLYCECAMTDDSKICDDNIELIYKTNNISLVNNRLWVAVRNKSDRTVYVDLGNSFFTSEQIAEPYYVPQITSSTSTTSTGVGVNAGAVTDALGIGGAAGTLAQGVNVGGGKSHGTSTSTFSQRVVAIPPKSTIELAPKFFVNRDKFFDNNIRFEITSYYTCIKLMQPKSQLFTVGTEKTYDDRNSLLHFSHFLTYSFDENITNPAKLNASFYVNRAIGVKNRPVYDNGGAYWGIDDGQLSDNYNTKLRVLIRQKSD